MKKNFELPTLPQQVLLMARPDFYAVPPADNEGKYANQFAVEGYKQYTANPAGFVSKAVSQWEALRDTLVRLGCGIIEMKAEQDRPDFVFTADPSLSLDVGQHGPVTVFSKFMNKQRQNETALHVAFMEKAMPNRMTVSAMNELEGTGDNVYDPFRDLYWCGHLPESSDQHASAGRSHKHAHELLTQMTGVETVSLGVKEPFFHIDTSLGFLSRGHVVAYPGGMTPDAYEKFKYNAFTRYGLDPAEYLIEISKQDAEKYAANLRCVGNTVVMSECSKELQDKIRSKGYDVVALDMSQFIASGGSVHCVTNNVNEVRIEGGYIKLLQEAAQPAKRALPNKGMHATM